MIIVGGVMGLLAGYGALSLMGDKGLGPFAKAPPGPDTGDKAGIHLANTEPFAPTPAHSSATSS